MKAINFKKTLALLLVVSGFMMVASTASAGSHSYVYGYGYGTTSSNSYQQHRPQYQQQRPQSHRPQYQQQRPQSHRPQYQQQRPQSHRPQYQQPTVVNIYNNQPSYRSSRPSHNHRPNYNYRPHVVIVEKHKPVKTKDLAKVTGVLLGIHCVLGGCF